MIFKGVGINGKWYNGAVISRKLPQYCFSASKSAPVLGGLALLLPGKLAVMTRVHSTIRLVGILVL